MTVHERFGRIPDFKYPAEVVTFTSLEDAVAQLAILQLSVETNEASKYDAMVWDHALAQTLIGVVHPENIPESWKRVFSAHSQRILRSYINDIQRAVADGAESDHVIQELQELPRSERGLSVYLETSAAVDF